MEKRMEQQTRIKTVEILVGIPCSGKSTYCNSYIKKTNFNVSKDRIREYNHEFKQPYKFSSQNENRVTEIFNEQLNYFLTIDFIQKVILDNTHCQQKYIDKIICDYGKTYNIQIKFFDISLFKAHYRNIIRYFKTGKWIPINIMNSMYKNYNKINKKKYEKYLVY